MSHPLDRCAGLYPPGKGLAWAIAEDHTIKIMHFHMRSATLDSRHNIVWEQEEQFDDVTKLHYDIKGSTPVDEEQIGHVTQMFEASIKTPDGEMTYREDSDIRTYPSSEGDKIIVKVGCTAHIAFHQVFPESIQTQIRGRKLSEIVGGDHPLIQAIGDQVIRTVLSMGGDGIRTIFEFDCTDWVKTVTDKHESFENNRLQKALQDA